MIFVNPQTHFPDVTNSTVQLAA